VKDGEKPLSNFRFTSVRYTLFGVYLLSGDTGYSTPLMGFRVVQALVKGASAQGYRPKLKHSGLGPSNYLW
jgi:hypothetical protein